MRKTKPSGEPAAKESNGVSQPDTHSVEAVKLMDQVVSDRAAALDKADGAAASEAAQSVEGELDDEPAAAEETGADDGGAANTDADTGPAGAEDADAGVPTTAPANAIGSKAAEETGVSMSAEGDLEAFLSALLVNVCVGIGCVVGFVFLRNIYEKMYSNNVLCGVQKIQPEETTLGWARGALFQAGLDENIEAIGMDNAFLIEFTNLCMKIMATIAVPMICLMGPINCMLGSVELRKAKGKEKCADAEACFTAGKDYLSYLSFGNVENSSQRGCHRPRCARACACAGGGHQLVSL